MAATAKLLAHAGPQPPSVNGRQAFDSSPEEIFLIWLLSLSLDADIAMRARSEIARLDRAAPLEPGPARLRELFVQAAAPSPGRRSRTRQQH